MAKVILKKPVEHDGKSWSEFELDPSLGALREFTKALDAGANEVDAMIDLMTADGDVPQEVVLKIRSSDLEAAMAEFKPASPLPSSTPPSAETGEAGELSQPMRHTS